MISFELFSHDRYVDFLNIMAYDFHGKWESKTGHNAPLFASSSETEWRKQLCVVCFDPLLLLFKHLNALLFKSYYLCFFPAKERPNSLRTPFSHMIMLLKKVCHLLHHLFSFSLLFIAFPHNTVIHFLFEKSTFLKFLSFLSCQKERDPILFSSLSFLSQVICITNSC